MPFPLKLVLVIWLQVSPEGTVSVSVRVPVSPWINAIVMVEAVDEPTLTELGGVVVIAKSGGTPNVNEAREVWVRPPFTAVMVTAYTP